MRNDIDDQDDAGQSALSKSVSRRINEAKSAYELATSRLWAANAAGAFGVASASFAGKAQTPWTFLALGMFSIGLFALSIGAAWSLVRQGRLIKDLENARSFLDVKSGTIRRPSAEAGLTPLSVQTLTGAVAASTFFLGVFFCLFQVYRELVSNYHDLPSDIRVAFKVATTWIVAAAMIFLVITAGMFILRAAQFLQRRGRKLDTLSGPSLDRAKWWRALTIFVFSGAGLICSFLPLQNSLDQNFADALGAAFYASALLSCYLSPRWWISPPQRIIEL